jgi:hypothetical protein
LPKRIHSRTRTDKALHDLQRQGEETKTDHGRIRGSQEEIVTAKIVRFKREYSPWLPVHTELLGSPLFVDPEDWRDARSQMETTEWETDNGAIVRITTPVLSNIKATGSWESAPDEDAPGSVEAALLAAFG